MSQTFTGGLLTSNQSQNTRSPNNPATEFFKRIIRDSGISLSSTDDPNVITQEQALVVRALENQLRDVESAGGTDKFLRGFNILINKEKYMKKSLLPTIFNKNSNDSDVFDDDNTIKIPQESLFRLFLKVDELQEKIIEVLLDQMTNHCDDEQDSSYLRLLLSQLRYLPNIKNANSLTTKLLDILEIASFPCQHEILDSIPEIVPDSEYNDTAKQLSKMLEKNEELSSAIVDCLNALNLDQTIRSEVQDYILSKILLGTSTKTFPVLLEFLMTDYKAQTLTTTLFKIRNALDKIMATGDNKNEENESGKIVIFNRLQALTTKKSEAWLTVISTVKLHTDHKPIDLLILFMLHSNTKLKKRPINIMFRKRIKDGLFKCPLLENFFEKCIPQQLLKDYFASIVEIGCHLLRTSNEVTIIEFSTTLFKLLFNHRHTYTIYRQEILDSLILLTGASDHRNTPAVLNIFTVLLDDITKIQGHTLLLMRLLEKLDRFDLKEVKQVFEILCTLTCSDENLSDLQHEIHMIVRKQLSSCKRPIKLRGIISAVVMAKHVATTNEDQSDVALSEDSFLTVSNLKSNAKEAAKILELANTSTSNSPELLGLYYDQLASMLVCADQLDKSFVAWLYETVTNDFQNVFVTEKVCDNVNDLEFEMQFNLNSSDEIDSPLAVNIAELTLNPKIHSIVLLSPHFRLLRLLHYRQQNGDLSSIDALLGCSVVLPKTDLLDSLDSDQRKQVTDCLFHCINWFREIISGFVTQKSLKLRAKVIQRLDNLIELENLLHKCLEDIPEHKLPVSYFDAPSQVSKQSVSPQKDFIKPKKAAKRQKTNDETSVTPTAGPSTAKASTNKKTPTRSIDNQPINFREMDTDIVKLIKYPLEKEAVSQTSDQTTLNINQLNFMLKDFASKLSLLTTNRYLGLSHLNTVAPLDLVTDCVHILPNVNRHFIAINKMISQVIDSSDGCQDSLEMFTDEIIDYKVGFGLILEILALIFSWSGFQHSKRLGLLRDLLSSFRRPESTQTLNSANRLIVELVDRLSGYVDHCLVMAHGVSLVKIMEALHGITPGQEIRSKIAKSSGKLLTKRWYSLKGSAETGKGCAANLDILIKSYLSSANINTICGLVGTLQEQVPNLKTREDALQMLRSVDKTNFYILYRNLWNSLFDRLKIEIQSLTNNQHLILWKTTALTMQGLMTVAKAQETKSNLVCFLKKSIAILKVFLSDGIPIMEIMLKHKPDHVVEILKIIQTNTRFLHHLCCQSKLTKDAGLMNYVPQFRLTLETLVYRVKGVLVVNGCSAAFWMGNLRNRDLHGEDILSQSTESTTRQGGEDEEEELGEDEESDEDIITEDTNRNNNTSGSEVYD